jgi:L-amino acid N-acyltransferase YncA
MATVVTRVSSRADIEGILALHRANLKRNLSEQEIRSQGFVSAEYTLDYLVRMNAASPSVIALDAGIVVGYALVSEPEVIRDHDLLGDLANVIDRTSYHDRLLKGSRYVISGQLCVARSHRGRGLVKQMYEHFRQELSGKFDYLITDIARDNPGSLIAHLRSGFEVISTLNYGGVEWDLMLWDWTRPAA